jgi:hypothetical protein
MKKIISNSDKKPTSKEVMRPLTLEHAKEIVMRSTLTSIDSSASLKELAEKQFPEMFTSGDLMPSAEMSKNIDNVSLSLSLETGHILAESVSSRYRGFALAFKKDLEKEFDCKSASERAIVDQAVNAHIRKLTYSKLMEGHNEPDWLSKEKVAFLNFYSKEVDRAHRQFLSAIETLRFMKQPIMKVNIKTNTAFVGEKQQFNTKIENNEAK